jgi:hypothetical protein
VPGTSGIASLSLDSARWHELQHAYGPASDIPALLQQLASLPSSKNASQPWFSLWSALAHQGDVYQASFAAVPHVVAVLATSPSTADFNYFQFPALVEVWRRQRGVAIPEDLKADYFAALAALPALVAKASHGEWDEGFLVSALAAVAAAKGFAKVAEAVLELTPDVADEFMTWFGSR